MDESLRVCDVEKYYGTKNNITKAVNQVSFTVEKGEFTGIMGPSGSGKTTLLNLLSTIDRVTAGHIYYGDTDITELDEPTGALDSRSAQMLLNTFCRMNEELGATILMVTHDAFSASYCKRILFLKDGGIFNELIRGRKSRREFLNEILDVLALTGGDSNYVK